MNNIPICDCFGEVVKSSASGKEFWYCRSCKKEVLERPQLEIEYLPLECASDNFIIEDLFGLTTIQPSSRTYINWISNTHIKKYGWST